MTHYFQKAIFGLFFLLCFYNANSRILKVDDTGYSSPSIGGTQTLPMAIAAASPNDTILINIKGTMIVAGPNLVFNKPLTILGPSAAHFTIDANSWEIIFNIPAGNILVDGIRFTNLPFLCGNFFSVQQGTNLTIRNCVFEATQISGDGGGIKMMNNAVLKVENTSFFNCSASGNGGGVYVGATNSATFTNCTFFGNNAVNGGAICNDGNATIVNCTFLNNTASGLGTAVRDNNSSAGTSTVIQNNIFTSASSPNLILSSGQSWITNGGNVFSSTAGSLTFITPGPSDITGQSLASIGLRANAVMDGYGLKYYPIISSGSPAVENGISNSLVLPSDCRRAPRALNGNGGATPKIDAGAVEFTPFTITSNSAAGLNTVWNNMCVSSFTGPKYMDFDITGGGPVNYNMTANLNNSASPGVDWIIDGFTQNGSVVAGPGSSPNTYAPAIYMVRITNTASDVISLTNPGNNSFISGLWIDNGGGNVGLKVNDGRIHIYGNHIISASSGNGGIWLTGANNALIGGDFHWNRNVIGGQVFVGVHAQNNTVNISGNFIGTSATGLATLTNDKGILLQGTFGTIKGKFGLPSMNLVSGNSTSQIEVASGGFDIKGNIIGPDVTGNSLLTTTARGILAGINTGGSIGGLNVGELNVIGGNTEGILLTAVNSANIYQNFIGVSPNPGFPSIPNVTGISIVDNGDMSHYIGDGSFRGRNYICNNSTIGIYMENAYNHTIMGNFVGIKPDNSVAGNGTRGIHLTGASTEGNNILGNIIGGNPVAGIDVNGANGSGNISGNKIGTDSTGMVSRANGRGIQVAATAPNSQIIGNLISGNTNEGIHLDNSIHTVQDNIIGMNLDTTLVLPNGGTGLTLLNANNCNIFNNYIGGNGANGILLMACNGNQIKGNSIGTNRSGLNFGNQLHGIALFFVGNNNQIGGSVASDYNDIMFNLGAGIDVERESSITAILGNHFKNNGAHGITLNAAVNASAPLANDVNDPDVSGPSGPNVGNNGQNFPDLISAISSAGTTTLSGTMNVDNTTSNYLFQVYKVSPGNIDASGHGEGDTLLLQQSYNAGGLNTFPFTLTLTNVSLGDVLSVTCSKMISTNYETSEFSDTIVIRAPYIASLIDSADVKCFGAANGRLEVAVTGGTNPPYNYQWFLVGGGPVGGNADTLIIGPGTYVCQVTDAGSVSVYSDTATIVEPPQLTATCTPTNTTCSGTCDGMIVINQTGGTAPYQYSINNGSTYQASNTFNGLCAGTNNFVVKDFNGCLSPTTGNVVNIFSPPALFLTPTFTNETCSGLNDGTITVTVSGGTAPHNYRIDGGTYGPGTFFGGLTPGNHIVDVMDANGCTSNILVNILAGDLVTANFSSTFGTGCEDIADFNFTDLSTSSNGSITTWNWTFSGASPSSATIPNVSGVIFFTPGTNNVTLNVASTSGCTATMTLPVTVNANPIVNAGADANACIFGTFTQAATITGNGPFSISWNPSSNFVTSTIEDPTVSTTIMSATGSYTHTLNVIDINGCTGTDNMVLTINSLPTVNAGLDGTVCQGTPYTLTGSGTASSYTWDNSVIDGTSFNPSSTLTYTVTGTDANFCQATDQVTINVLTSPVANAGLDATICNGQSYVLDGSASTGATSYLWDEVGVGSFSTAVTANVAPTTSTAYALSVSNGSCSDVDTMILTVVSAPDPTFAYSPSIFCINDTDPTPISITTPGGIFSMPASSSINPSTGLISISAIGAGTFDVVYTLSTPCFAVDTFQIVVNALPNATVNGTLEMCINTNPFDLNTILNPPTPGGNWTGTGVSGTNFDPSLSGAGTFGPVYTVTDANGCTNADSATIIVNALPVVNISGVNPNYCITDPPFSPVGTPAGGTFLIDAVNVGAITSVDPSTFSAGLHTMNYQFTDPVTGCANTTIPTSFTIFNVPLDPTTSTPLNQTICAGASVSLVVANPNTGGGTTLAWYADPGYTQFLANGPTFNSPILTSTISYYCVVQNNGCKSNPLVFTITVNNAQVSAGPDLTICPGTPAQLNVSSFSGTISWSPGISLDDSTIQNPLATPNVNTTYFVTVTSGPCSDTDSVTVFIDGSNPNCGITPSYNAFSPDGDGVNDGWIIDAIYNHPDNVVTIFNRWGDKLVSFDDYDNVNIVWDGKYKGNLLPSGTYFYMIEYLDINMQVSGWLQLTR